MTFPQLGNSDQVVVSVSIDIPINSKQDAPFHHMTYDYSLADWDGLCGHLTNVPWEDIFVLLLLLENFVSGFRLELMCIYKYKYVFLILTIRSKLTHLNGI